MRKTVGIFSTLDTKAAETYFLKAQIEMRGCDTIVLDLGTRGLAGIPADVTREEIFARGNIGDGAFAAEDRVKLGEIMTAGASAKISELYAAGKVQGVIGIGGATNSLMETNIMRTLPFGVPKLMVCSVAAAQGLASRYFGTSDIAILHSVVDFTGLNDLIRDVLERAAGSIVGMVQKSEEVVKIKSNKSKKLVAMTQLSLCERTASLVRERLEEEGYQVIGFSATGVADKAMEELITKENMFAAVIDLAPGGVGEQIFGGTRAAGPNRLEAAGKNGIPQIIAPCAVNLMTPPRSKYKPDYYQRQKYDLDALRTFLRLNDEELLIVARTMAPKLNLAKSRVKFLIPLKGWASFDIEGCAVYQPESDSIFIQEIKQQVKDHVEVIEVNANLDEPEFAEAVLKAFKEIMGDSMLRRDAG
ncbi:Tm-1-like ATP-binding domain-containing protein [Paradesulfitobacterium aromaticivorans]